MKRVPIIISVVLLCSMMTFAQNEDTLRNQNQDEVKTLFGNHVENGVYGALMFNYSTIDGQDAWLVGGRGGWLIDHRLMIGLGGYGFANDMYFDDVVDGQGYNLAGGYGGLVIEPILMPRFPVHLSFPILIGAGGVAYVDPNYGSHNNYDWHAIDSDAFLVIEPGVELELNLIKYFRVAFAVTYRHTEDVSLINSDPDVLDGFNFGMTFKFGKF
jgi:hypothetical protein